MLKYSSVFLGYLKALLLNTNGSVAAAWEWGIIVCVHCCLCRYDLLGIHSSFPKLILRRGLSSGDKACLPPDPMQQYSFGWWLFSGIPTSVATLRARIEQPSWFVSWLAEYWSSSRQTCQTSSCSLFSKQLLVEHKLKLRLLLCRQATLHAYRMLKIMAKFV